MRVKRYILTFIFLVCFANSAFTSEDNTNASSIPVEHFFKDAQFSDMVISPDGKHIAAIYDDEENSTSVAIMAALQAMLPMI